MALRKPATWHNLRKHGYTGGNDRRDHGLYGRSQAHSGLRLGPDLGPGIQPGFPRAKELKFRLQIVMDGPVCRLDYTDETHPNSIDGYTNGWVPMTVTGPHYHSWPINQRFFRGVTKPPKLHDALSYTEPGRAFDAILRWFCTDTNIDSLPGSHLIGLPEPGLLI